MKPCVLLRQNAILCAYIYDYAIYCFWLCEVFAVKHEPWVSLDDIAEHLGVSRDTVYRWIDDRGMPAHKVGRLWKFKVSEVDEWIRAGDSSRLAKQG